MTGSAGPTFAGAGMVGLSEDAGRRAERIDACAEVDECFGRDAIFTRDRIHIPPVRVSVLVHWSSVFERCTHRPPLTNAISKPTPKVSNDAAAAIRQAARAALVDGSS